ncbi:MAG TPA: group II intron reverse transcriptase/maturase [Verrucomicrobia bacterium]|nr:group II intron reverse transcriptase/maturase [Verrucomicrobiota bacterium]
MTSRQQRDGAFIDDAKKWASIDWKTAQREVRRLQIRIAKAVQEGHHGRARALQWVLTHSFHAKALAVKRVTSNKGRKTPGVDGVLWQGARAKWQALGGLRRHGYNPQPLRRIYLEKKNGKKRPLGIPTLFDRAMQALYKLALAPVAETTADRNSYGFREGRCCADAVAAAFNALAKSNSATWVMEADIAGCYDNISKGWMLSHIPMDKEILRKWLEAGYCEDGHWYPTHKGTPQGGIISPLLANMTLDGLESAIDQAVPRRQRVNFVRYADDFIVTGKSKRLLVEVVRPAVEKFLKERGLELSSEKTAITRIHDGFTFLGQTFCKHGSVLHIVPARKGVLALLEKIGELLRRSLSAPIEAVVAKLNSVLRGWALYHRHVVASRTFSRVDTYVYEQLWRFLRRKHPGKSRKWLARKYWSATRNPNVFAVRSKYKTKTFLLSVIRIASIGIKRHIKIRAEANPYRPEDAGYFWRRRQPGARFMSGLSARAVRAQA